MSTTEHAVLLDEDFKNGLDPARWQVFAGEGFAADDGVATPAARGVTIAPPTRDPQTGAPVFTKDLDGYPSNLKWLVTANETFATGEDELRFRFRAGARAFGLDRHPYGDAVDDPATDFRLGSATINVLDFESGLVLDFWISHGVISAFHERLRPPGMGLDYEAFTAWSSLVARTPDAIHDLCISVNASAGTVRWEVDGEEVAKLDRLGARAPGWDAVLDLGGTPEAVRPRQLGVGMGLMTMLHASHPPGHEGLVDLGHESDHIGERRGPVKTFRGGPRLFGQGVELHVERIVVERA